jgi:hypothetical protein
MRPRHRPLLLAALSVLLACDRVESVPARESTAALPASPADGHIADAWTALVAATKLAYALEDTVRTQFGSLRSEAELRAIFDRGYEPAAAKALTARLWDTATNARPRVQPGTRATLGVLRAASCQQRVAEADRCGGLPLATPAMISTRIIAERRRRLQLRGGFTTSRGGG